MVNEIRAIPGGETVLYRIGLIDPRTRGLIPGTEVEEIPDEELKGRQIIRLRNFTGDSKKAMRITIGKEDIEIIGRKATSTLDGKKAEQCVQVFDRRSKVELLRTIIIGEDGKITTRDKFSRDSKDIEKVEYDRQLGDYPIKKVLDISRASADISSLDAFNGISDEDLYEMEKEEGYSFMGLGPGERIEEKILSSKNSKGCGVFIKRARGFNNLQDGDLEEILRQERMGRDGINFLKSTEAILEEPMSPGYGGKRNIGADGRPCDKFGYPVTKTGEELKNERKLEERRRKLEQQYSSENPNYENGENDENDENWGNYEYCELE